MYKNDFFNIITNYAKQIDIELSEKQKEMFYDYMNLLLEWNESINLTSITEPNEVILKHFIDSITISKYIKEGSYVADIGTGAGFPGIPLKIIREDINIVLVDSLNKRINFLNEVINKLDLKNIQAIHARAEDFAHDKKFREQFDIVTSRAVANMSTLSEYLLPLIKEKGKCLCMKGPDIEEEIDSAKNAISILGGTITNVHKFNLPNSDIGRTVVDIEKSNSTDKKYPRKAGVPSKNPLV